MSEFDEEIGYSRDIDDQVIAIYNQTLAEFLSLPDAVAQPPETSWEASKIIIDAVEDAPQDPAGDNILIAHELLSHISGDEGIGIREMAQVIPDGERCADEMNLRHKKFNILKEIGFIRPTTAMDLISTFAANSLEKIRKTTLSNAKALQIQVPDALKQSVRKTSDLTPSGLSGPWIINRQVAYALDDFLNSSSQKTLRSSVVGSISLEANDVRLRSRSQQKTQIHRVREKFQPPER